MSKADPEATYVMKEYIVVLKDESLKIFHDDVSLRSIGKKTNCCIKLTGRILNRRINSLGIIKYAIIKIDGDKMSSIEQCNLLLEKRFPQYRQRKEYQKRPDCCTLYLNECIPDNSTLYFQFQSTEPSHVNKGCTQQLEMNINYTVKKCDTEPDHVERALTGCTFSETNPRGVFASKIKTLTNRKLEKTISKKQNVVSGRNYMYEVVMIKVCVARLLDDPAKLLFAGIVDHLIHLLTQIDASEKCKESFLRTVLWLNDDFIVSGMISELVELLLGSEEQFDDGRTLESGDGDSVLKGVTAMCDHYRLSIIDSVQMHEWVDPRSSDETRNLVIQGEIESENDMAAEDECLGVSDVLNRVQVAVVGSLFEYLSSMNTVVHPIHPSTEEKGSVDVERSTEARLKDQGSDCNVDAIFVTGECKEDIIDTIHVLGQQLSVNVVIERELMNDLSALEESPEEITSINAVNGAPADLFDDVKDAINVVMSLAVLIQEPTDTYSICVSDPRRSKLCRQSRFFKMRDRLNEDCIRGVKGEKFDVKWPFVSVEIVVVAVCEQELDRVLKRGFYDTKMHGLGSKFTVIASVIVDIDNSGGEDGTRGEDLITRKCSSINAVSESGVTCTNKYFQTINADTVHEIDSQKAESDSVDGDCFRVNNVGSLRVVYLECTPQSKEVKLASSFHPRVTMVRVSSDCGISGSTAMLVALESPPETLLKPNPGHIPSNVVLDVVMVMTNDDMQHEYPDSVHRSSQSHVLDYLEFAGSKSAVDCPQTLRSTVILPNDSVHATVETICPCCCQVSLSTSDSTTSRLFPLLVDISLNYLVNTNGGANVIIKYSKVLNTNLMNVESSRANVRSNNEITFSTVSVDEIVEDWVELDGTGARKNGKKDWLAKMDDDEVVHLTDVDREKVILIVKNGCGTPENVFRLEQLRERSQVDSRDGLLFHLSFGNSCVETYGGRETATWPGTRLRSMLHGDDSSKGVTASQDRSSKLKQSNVTRSLLSLSKRTSDRNFLRSDVFKQSRYFVKIIPDNCSSDSKHSGISFPWRCITKR